MRVALYIMVLIVSIENIWLLAIPLAVLYGFRYTSFELLAIAVLIDGYTGQFFVVPTLSILTIIGIIIVEWVKPIVMNYTY